MKILQHRFVEFIPDSLEADILYVSMEYCTAIHKCVCGCGNKVVTPISPVGWQLKFDGKSISLTPSIGNWSFGCKSHYFITKNQIRWLGQWDETQVAIGRKQDLERKDGFFDFQKGSAEQFSKEIKSVGHKHKKWSWKSLCWFLKFSKN